MEESGVVYAWSGASAFRLSISGSIYQDLRTPAIFYQQFWAEKRWNFCQQDTADGFVDRIVSG